ncbi:MAG: GIN domain-containing protein, partial [Ramlibacter sp.]
MAAFPLSRRRAVFALAATAAALAAGSAAAWTTVRGNGVKRSEARNLTGFTGVATSVPGQLEVRLGPVESVTVETDENILPLIETRVVAGTLRIRVAPGETIETRTLRIVVQARQLDVLALSGSGNIVGDGI